VSAAETGYLSASADIPFLSGLKDAVSAINSAGGVDGRKLVLSAVLDEQSTAATGVANVNQLINQDHVDVIMAGSDSTACASAESAVTAAQTPMTCISPTPAGSAYQFQVAASVPGMVADEMGYLKSRHVTSVALVDVSTVYGEIIGKIIKGLAAADGIKVAYTTTVSATATDLTATMQAVKAAHPGAVVDSITGPEHVVEAKGAAAAGLSVPLIQITDTTNVFQEGAQAYPDLYFVALPPQAYPSVPGAALASAIKPFWIMYASQNGGSTAQIAAAAYGWDAVHILAAAMAKAGAFTGPKLQAALQDLTYQGVNSLFKYSATDHSGESTVPNPDSIGHFSASKLQIVYNAS
jgi:branched-chain amino acid transport system substrate-binding protein